MPKRRPLPLDRHLLYEAAVQDVDFDLGFFQRIYRKLRGQSFIRLREDFCGTARLACEWVRRKPERTAVAVDLNAETLAWASLHHVAHIGAAASRLKLVRGDVRSVEDRADVVAALNCSYWVFKQRDTLIGYFRHVRARLRPQGLLFLDAFGGEGAMRKLTERRAVRGARTYAGERVPPFTYFWEQRSFNPVDHHIFCHIHFRMPNGRMLRRAFTYDWRLWTLPEIADALREAGFADVQVYVQGWDDDENEPLNVYRRRGRFENQEAWLAYLVGVK